MRQSTAGSLAKALALGVLLLLPAPADASLMGTAQVRVTDGASLDVSDDVAIGVGAEITPGDGSNIGALLLPGESIDLGGFTIDLVLEEGADDGTTGYPAGTQIVFANLDFGDPTLGIVGIGVELVNISGVALGSEITFTGNSIAVRVDTLGIGGIAGAIDAGTIRLDLEVAQVPEPGSFALAALGMTLLVGGRALRPRVE
jgi:hypothetical protein